MLSMPCDLSNHCTDLFKQKTLDVIITQRNLLFGQVYNKLTTFHTLVNESLLKMNELVNILLEQLLILKLRTFDVCCLLILKGLRECLVKQLHVSGSSLYSKQFM
jgi:hypothetical protein